ncbi:hypothetical protein L9F63_021367, partial [Diploptera punctata]
ILFYCYVNGWKTHRTLFHDHSYVRNISLFSGSIFKVSGVHFERRMSHFRNGSLLCPWNNAKQFPVFLDLPVLYPECLKCYFMSSWSLYRMNFALKYYF